ncbi:hypothetical protein ABE10_25550 [Bacillus toyonensis]|nr:hypothetical protein [Bacillus toyonensis]
MAERAAASARAAAEIRLGERVSLRDHVGRQEHERLVVEVLALVRVSRALFDRVAGPIDVHAVRVDGGVVRQRAALDEADDAAVVAVHTGAPAGRDRDLPEGHADGAFDLQPDGVLTDAHAQILHRHRRRRGSERGVCVRTSHDGRAAGSREGDGEDHETEQPRFHGGRRYALGLVLDMSERGRGAERRGL